MFNSRRLTIHYEVFKRGDVLEIHHSPVFLYWMDKERFFRCRKKAYVKLAGKIKEGKGFYKNITGVKGTSFLIQYDREVSSAKSSKPPVFKRILDVLLRSLNMRNWVFLRIKTIFYPLRSKDYHEFYLQRDEFLSQWGRRGEG